jgi:hypothetical protein
MQQTGPPIGSMISTTMLSESVCSLGKKSVPKNAEHESHDNEADDNNNQEEEEDNKDNNVVDIANITAVLKNKNDDDDDNDYDGAPITYLV